MWPLSTDITKNFKLFKCFLNFPSWDYITSVCVVNKICCCLVVKSGPMLCDPLDCSSPGFPVLHYLPVCSNLWPLSQWCHPTIPSSAAPFFPPALNLSQHQGLFQWVGFLYQVQIPFHIKYWSSSFSISPSNEYSGLISFRIDWFDLCAVQGTLQEYFPAPQFKSINSLALSLLYGSTLTSVHDYWKNHS